MRIAAYSVFCAAALFYMLKSGLYFLHMLQLSSYKPERYLDWCGSNIRKLLLPCLPLALAAEAVSELLRALPDSAAALFSSLGAGALLFLLCGFRKRPKAKKPLVMTARAKRLFGTLAFLGLAAAVGGGFMPLHAGVKLTAALCFPWLLLAIALALCAPYERACYVWYFNKAKNKLADSNATVIGITGSYGKTSTKYILGRLLSPFFNTLITPESYNTPMGVSKVINGQLKPTHEIFVAEMGAAKVGDIAELCRLCGPKYGVISSIGPQHLKTMHTLGNIIRTKFELADAVAANGGVMFLNYDNEYIREHGCACRAVTYGIEARDVDLRAENIRAGADGLRFTIVTRGGSRTEVRTGLLGRHNVINILAAAAVAVELGVPADKLPAQIARLEPVPHRLQLLREANGVTIIDDAYNSNPSGAEAALEALSWFEGMKICVTPGMVELGGEEDARNRELGSKAAGICDLLITVGGKRADAIKEGALAGGMPPEKIIAAETFRDAAAIFYGYSPQHPTVLLENDLPDNY